MRERNTFVQSYGSPHLDASLLLIPQVGFLPPDDPRVRGTVEAIERNLVVDGLVLRYSTATDVDALPPGEGAFLPCSFWLADSLVLIGRREEGEALFERLLALSNDLGLLAEEYDTRERHMLGNFPQALTHMALINTARLLSIPVQQAKRASEKGERPNPSAVAMRSLSSADPCRDPARRFHVAVVKRNAADRFDFDRRARRALLGRGAQQRSVVRRLLRLPDIPTMRM